MSREYPLGPLREPSFRWRAFAIHLGISLAILAVLLWLLFFHWFPGYLFDTDGGWQAAQIIIGVDIVLGPLLTLIAANPAKTTAHLRKDFTVIALVQVAALSVGTWIAWENRPYALLWSDGVVRSMPAAVFRDEPAARDWIRAQPGALPVAVYVDLPADPEVRGEIFLRARQRGSIAIMEAEHYRAWPGEVAELARQAARLRPDLDALPALRPALDQWQAAGNPAGDAVLLVPAASRYGTYVMVLARSDGRMLGALDVALPRHLFQ